MIRTSIILAVLACPAIADTVVAARTIPARTIIGPDDLLLRDLQTFGAVEIPSEIVGLETRVALYAGRPIRSGDVGPPAVIERNQVIALIYSNNGVVISTEGRALDRAGPGDVIRVMNIMSRQTVSARIDNQGVAYVAQ